MDYKNILTNEIYPALSSRIDAAFPEFEFMEKGQKWISTNTLHLSGIEGVHGKGKVTITKSKPYVIGDFREGTKEVIKYLVESSFHSRIFDFKTAVEYLGYITNIDLKNRTNFYQNWSNKNHIVIPKKRIEIKPSFIPHDLFKASLKEYENNSFTCYLKSLLGTQKAKELIDRFFIGTSKKWNGSPVFWQIDTSKKIRAGKIMGYHSETGKRKKRANGNGYIDWVHSILERIGKVKNYNLVQCPFGEHQILLEPNKPIAIVESEKTAIIATAYLPDYLWLATGGIGNLSRIKSLFGKNITLFPDNGAFEAWSKKAESLNEFANVTISDLLERKGKPKSDLADYLIQFDWKVFQPEPKPKVIPLFEINHWEALKIVKWTKKDDELFNEAPKEDKLFWTWAKEIEELKIFFEKNDLNINVKLSSNFEITDVPKFVQNHLRIVETNNGKETYLPYLERLREVRGMIERKIEVTNISPIFVLDN